VSYGRNILEILDFAPLVKKYTWNKSDDERAYWKPTKQTVCRDQTQGDE
jgi:hypothetical protein